MDGAQARLSPKDAGAKGIESFKQIMPLESYHRVLLEGLELDADSDRWIVTIGFDSIRPVLKQPFSSGYDNALLKMFGSIAEKPVESEVVREFRTFILDASDGRFVKMEHG